MVLSKRYIIKPNHKNYDECKTFTHLSKNLYNQALYRVRQYYFESKKHKGFFDLAKELRKEVNVDYYALPTKVSSMCLRKLDNNFKSFFNANKDFKINPKKYKAKPRIPKYLDKDGYFLTEYHKESISKRQFDKGYINPSKTNIFIPIRDIVWKDIVGVRIVPRNGYFIIEILYNKIEQELKTDNKKYASIDLGINNLATITFNTKDKPFIINGKPIKSVNQYYNKKRAKLSSELEIKNKSKKSNRLNRLTLKRFNKINDYLHKSSTYIANQLVSKSINTLIIGRNKDWKQDVNIGKRNNQNFVSIPFYRFIQMLEYKCKLRGINVILNEENYTSKCSFLDLEEVCKNEIYLGKRIKRGLFRSSSGKVINADVNGSYNILRKVVPNVFSEGIEDLPIHPLKINFS